MRVSFVCSTATGADKSRWLDALYKCSEQITARVKSMSVALDRAHMGARAGVASHSPAGTHSAPGGTPKLRHARSTSGSSGAHARARGSNAQTPRKLHRSQSDGAQLGSPASAPAFDSSVFDQLDFDASGVDLDGEYDPDAEDWAFLETGSEASQSGLLSPAARSSVLSHVPEADESKATAADGADCSDVADVVPGGGDGGDGDAGHAGDASDAVAVGCVDPRGDGGDDGDSGAGDGSGDSSHAQGVASPARGAVASADSDGMPPPLPTRPTVDSTSSDGPPPLLPSRPAQASVDSEGPPPLLPSRPAQDSVDSEAPPPLPDRPSMDGSGSGAGEGADAHRTCTVRHLP